jgi:sugar phosphate isomerase/epimerase
MGETGMYSRREFGRIALAGLPLATTLAAAKSGSVFGGVHLGVQTYSFRDFPPEGIIDALIKAIKEVGAAECEVFGAHFLPADLNPTRMMAGMGRPPGQPMDDAARQKMAEMRKAADEKASQWHMSTPISYFKDLGKKFKAAGIEIYGYNGGRFGSDVEINRSFEQTKALGAKMITSSGTLSLAKKLAPFADKHKFMVAMHGHSDVKDPEQFATPESFKKAMAMSQYFMINLDLGHFVAAGFDPIAFLQENHARVPLIHLKDRKKNQGPNTPFGQGDTPIKEVMQLIKKNKWPVRAFIEYEYKGSESSKAEVKKCLDYVKSALA